VESPRPALFAMVPHDETRRERRIDQWRVFGAFIFTLIAFVAMLTGCASGQFDPTPRVVREATECVKTYETCFMVHVTNDYRYRAVVRLNGVKIGEVEGNRQDSFSVPESRLRNGRCANVSVHLIGSDIAGSSDQQCLREGGYYTFQIDNQAHLWLTPWAGR
jgi:hypothetical protein